MTTFPPRLILFDCDGTLTNSHGAIVTAMQQAFESCGLKAPPSGAINDVIGLSLRKAVLELGSELQRSETELQERLIAAYRKFYLESEKQVALFPQVRETLDELKSRGYWMGVVTGKSLSGLKRVLDIFQLSEYFLCLRTADCTHSKPHPAMVIECMHELGVDAHHTSVVGDAVLDMQMALAAGVPAIGVSFGVAGSAALVQAGAGSVVDHFSELLVHYPRLHPHA